MKTKQSSKHLVLKRCIISLALLVISSFPAMSQVSLWVGESYNYDVTSSVMGITANISWSTNGGYISLSGSGFYRTITVTKYFSGTATVTCSWDYKLTSSSKYTHTSRSINITCRDNKVSISPANMTLTPGKTSYVSYSHQFQNQYTSAANAYFQSSNSSVVTVDEYSGKVTAVSPVTAYINVYSKISSESPYCKVTVEKVDPTSVSIPSNLTVYVGEESTITPSLLPNNAQTTFTWRTLNPSVATVTGGTVKGIDEGTTQVYCITANNLESNRCNVQAIYRKPEGIDVSPTSATINLYQTKQLSYTVRPSNAKTTVTWHSNDVDEKVIKLSSSGLVTPVAGGIAKVYAETDNGCKSYSTITVLPDPTNISIPKKMLLMYGDNKNINCKIEPSNAYADLKWTSDNPKVVRVNSRGEIEGVSGGSANITVESHNGKSATCYVEVPEPDHRIYAWFNDGTSISYPLKNHPKATFSEDMVILDGKGIHSEFSKTDFSRFTLANDMVSPMPSAIEMPSVLSMTYGDTYQMHYTLHPTDFVFETSLEWSSTNNHVVTVSNNGYVRAVGGGEADIILEASNGCKALCHVTIPDPEFYLVVWLRDGSKSVTHLREKPMLRYNNDVYTLVSKRAETEYQATDVSKITLADNPDGEISNDIANPILEGQEQVSRLDAETIVISGGSPDAITRVYTIAGLLVASFKADSNGTTIIPMSQLSTGVQIIKSETITFKIIRK